MEKELVGLKEMVQRLEALGVLIASLKAGGK